MVVRFFGASGPLQRVSAGQVCWCALEAAAAALAALGLWALAAGGLRPLKGPLAAAQWHLKGAEFTMAHESRLKGLGGP